MLHRVHHSGRILSGSQEDEVLVPTMQVPHIGPLFLMLMFLWIDINGEHGERAALVVEECIRDVFPSEKEKEFKPSKVMELLYEMMKSRMISIWSGMHESVVALSGILFFHRWMLYFVQKYPELLSDIEKTVEDFIKQEESRKREAIPDLGNFLFSLTISSHSWSEIAEAYLGESSFRSIPRMFPGVDEENPSILMERLSDERAFTEDEHQIIFNRCSIGSESLSFTHTERH